MLRLTAGCLVQMHVLCNSDIKLTTWQLWVLNQLCCCHRSRPGFLKAAYMTDVYQKKKKKEVPRSNLSLDISP